LEKQILVGKALDQQVDTLWRIVNSIENTTGDYRERLDKANRQIVTLQKKLKDTQQVAREAKRSARLSSAYSETAGQRYRTGKIPDPLILTDGENPTFFVWKQLMEDKLVGNYDHYERATPEATEHARVIYVKTRVQGEAASYLLPYIDAERSAGRSVTVSQIYDFLEPIYEGTNKRAEA
ncbi:hypothetical protein V8E54_003627, partial [Elaphomyces granulatus]